MSVKRIVGIFLGILLIFCCVLYAGCSRSDDRQTQEQTPAVFMKVPLARQASSYTCGVATLQSILAYNGFHYRQDVLSAEVGATYANGTNYKAIVASLQKRDIGAEFREDMSLDELKDYLASDQPVICMIQAWNDKEGFDYASGWDDGHYVIAIGYDDEKIYFMDPSILGNYAYLTNDEFEARWHDESGGEQYRNAGIVVTNTNPSYNPSEFKHID